MAHQTTISHKEIQNLLLLLTLSAALSMEKPTKHVHESEAASAIALADALTAATEAAVDALSRKTVVVPASHSRRKYDDRT